MHHNLIKTSLTNRTRASLKVAGLIEKKTNAFMTLHVFSPKRKFLRNEVMQTNLVKVPEYLGSFRLEPFGIF